MPEFSLTVKGGIVREARVIRGAPCGATWDAVQKVIGLPIEEASVRIGLETQFFCKADPAGWDPIFEKSPVHIAAHLHAAAFQKAIKQNETEE